MLIQLRVLFITFCVLFTHTFYLQATYMFILVKFDYMQAKLGRYSSVVLKYAIVKTSILPNILTCFGT